MRRKDMLGVPIDAVTQHEALQQIETMLHGSRQYHVCTPNPEMLVEAYKNPILKKVLAQAALNIPDGIGLVHLARLPARITGTDVMTQLCTRTNTQVFLLGAEEGIADKAASALQARNPALQVLGTYAGTPYIKDEQGIIKRINTAAPTLLFVAFGAPEQELWIARNMHKMPSVKVAIGVGGAFDFIAGKRKRAPQWMQRMGLEWLWRVLIEPRRFKRIWNAVVVFPWIVWTHSSAMADPVK